MWQRGGLHGAGPGSVRVVLLSSLPEAKSKTETKTVTGSSSNPVTLASMTETEIGRSLYACSSSCPTVRPGELVTSLMSRLGRWLPGGTSWKSSTAISLPWPMALEEGCCCPHSLDRCRRREILEPKVVAVHCSDLRSCCVPELDGGAVVASAGCDLLRVSLWLRAVRSRVPEPDGVGISVCDRERSPMAPKHAMCRMSTVPQPRWEMEP